VHGCSFGKFLFQNTWKSIDNDWAFTVEVVAMVAIGKIKTKSVEK
jgi:hypothetical protein